MTVTTDDIARAADVLRAGGLVAFPTETVYGLGADASSPAALARLYGVKGRPSDHPVIVHLPDARALDRWAVDVPEGARRLAASRWPGPLTLVLHRAPHVLDGVTGGQDTVALRVPDQPVALALLRAFGGGVAAPSANRFGRVSPTTADDVRADLGPDVDMVLDGGPCRIGVESTIVDCTRAPMRILRLGDVDRSDVAAVAGVPVEGPEPAGDERTGSGAAEVATASSAGPRVPGTLASHYAPRARVVVVAADELESALRPLLVREERVGLILAHGRALTGPAHPRLSILGAPSDGGQYAHDLYRMLRAADEHGLDVVVAVEPDVGESLGAAVADRLRRASAPRPPPAQEIGP